MFCDLSSYAILTGTKSKKMSYTKLFLLAFSATVYVVEFQAEQAVSGAVKFKRINENYFIFISFKGFFHCFLSFKFLLLTFQEIIPEKINFTQSSPVGNPLKKTLKKM